MPPKLARCLAGTMLVRVPWLFGLRRGRRIPIQLERELPTTTSGGLEFEVQLDVFCQGITLSSPLFGTATTDLATRRIQIQGDDDEGFELEGTWSADFQSMRVSARFAESFHACYESWQFPDQELELQASFPAAPDTMSRAEAAAARSNPEAFLADAGADVHRDDLGEVAEIMLNATTADVRRPQLIAAATFSHLQRLSILALELPEAALAELHSASTLRALDLQLASLTTVGTRVLARLPGLQELSLDDAQLAREAVASLADLPLTSLSLDSCDADDFDLRTLCRGLTNLEQLGLSHLEITASGFTELPHLANLSQLSCLDVALDDETLVNLGAAGRLHSLDLQGCTLTDQSIAACLRQASLRDLTVGYMEEITGKTWPHAVPNLKQLSVFSCPLGGEALRAIASWPDLKELWLEDTCVGDDDLSCLSECGNLQQITLRGESLSAAGRKSLQTALPQANVQS